MQFKKVFPIFELPIVALEHVLKSMSPMQLITFSQCSKDSKMLAKKTGSIWRDTVVVVKFEGICAIEMSPYGIKGAWRQRFNGWKKMKGAMELYSEVLNWKMSKLILSPENSEQAGKVGKVLREFQIYNSEDVEYVVDNSKVRIQHLILEHWAPKKLTMRKVSGFSRLHPNVEEIQLKRAHLYANDILSMNCSTIVLSDVCLGGGVCWLIKKWQNGCNARLEVLIGNVSMFSWTMTIANIPGGSLRDSNVRRKFRNRSESVQLEVNGGYDVERYDGTIGTICHLGPNRFCFLVWKDYC